MPDFANYAEEKLNNAIMDINKFCIDEDAESEQIKRWEYLWKKLVNMKKIWDNASWDEIEKDSGDEELISARKDETFKRYYKLREEVRKMEELCK